MRSPALACLSLSAPLVSSAILLSAVLYAPPALACGTSGPDGVSACSLAEHDEAVRKRWRVSVSGVFTNTALNFSGGLRTDETRFATLATLSYAPSARVALEVGAGAAFGGKLSAPDGPHEFSPGFVGAIGASWRVVDGTPFLVLSSQLSATVANTQRENAGPSTGYEAFDLRVGALFGTTLWNVLSPYVLARAFGGPVYWRYAGQAVTGTDVHHYQLGAGAAFLIARRWDMFIEGDPLGEQAIAAGVSFVF